MPYHVDEKNCVIKTSTGEVMGCHKTPEDAQRQIRAIEASEAEQRAKEKQSS